MPSCAAEQRGGTRAGRPFASAEAVLLGLLAALAVAAPADALAGQGRVVQLPEGALAYVPVGACGRRATLAVLLHGAGGTPGAMIARFGGEADRLGVVLAAPKSAGATWDVVARARREALTGPASAGQPYRYSGSPDGRRVADAIDAARSAAGVGAGGSPGRARATSDPARRHTGRLGTARSVGR